jgi:myo-inositol-1(or 4)-monophosphatase
VNTASRYELLNLAERASARAAAHIKASRRDQNLEIKTKSSPTDMVTKVDKETENIIREILLSERPNDGFMGEETEEVDSSEITWIVDPIDGTTNFIYDFPVYAVSIAARDSDGQIQVGVVTDVYHDDVYYATYNGGSYLNNRAIQVSKTTEMSKALIATGFSYDDKIRLRQANTLVTLIANVRDIRRAGAASLDLCYLAAGRTDGYYEIGLWPWDYSAGTLVVREAGGAVGSLFSEEPSGELTIAGNPSIYKSLKRHLLHFSDAL